MMKFSEKILSLKPCFLENRFFKENRLVFKEPAPQEDQPLAKNESGKIITERPKGQYYLVKKNDNLSGIAKVNYPDLPDAVDLLTKHLALTNKNKISRGQVVFLPDKSDLIKLRNTDHLDEIPRTEAELKDLKSIIEGSLKIDIPEAGSQNQTPEILSAKSIANLVRYLSKEASPEDRKKIYEQFVADRYLDKGTLGEYTGTAQQNEAMLGVLHNIINESLDELNKRKINQQAQQQPTQPQDEPLSQNQSQNETTIPLTVQTNPNFEEQNQELEAITEAARKILTSTGRNTFIETINNGKIYFTVFNNPLLVQELGLDDRDPNKEKNINKSTVTYDIDNQQLKYKFNDKKDKTINLSLESLAKLKNLFDFDPRNTDLYSLWEKAVNKKSAAEIADKLLKAGVAGDKQEIFVETALNNGDFRSVEFRIADKHYRYTYNKSADGTISQNLYELVPDKNDSKKINEQKILSGLRPGDLWAIFHNNEKNGWKVNYGEFHRDFEGFKEFPEADTAYYEKLRDSKRVSVTDAGFLIYWKNGKVDSFTVESTFDAGKVILLDLGTSKLLVDLREVEKRGIKVSVQEARDRMNSKEGLLYTGEGEPSCDHHRDSIIGVKEDLYKTKPIEAYVGAFKIKDQSIQTLKHFKEHASEVNLDMTLKMIADLPATPSAKLPEELIKQIELILPMGGGKKELFSNLRENPGNNLNSAVASLKEIGEILKVAKVEEDFAGNIMKKIRDIDSQASLEKAREFIARFVDEHPWGTAIIAGATLALAAKMWKAESKWGKGLVIAGGVGAFLFGTKIADEVINTFTRRLLPRGKVRGLIQEFLIEAGLDNDDAFVRGLAGISDLPFSAAHQKWEEGAKNQTIDFTDIASQHADDPRVDVDLMEVKYLDKAKAFKMVNNLIFMAGGPEAIKPYLQLSGATGKPYTMLEVIQAIVWKKNPRYDEKGLIAKLPETETSGTRPIDTLVKKSDLYVHYYDNWDTALFKEGVLSSDVRNKIGEYYIEATKKLADEPNLTPLQEKYLQDLGKTITDFVSQANDTNWFKNLSLAESQMAPLKNKLVTFEKWCEYQQKSPDAATVFGNDFGLLNFTWNDVNKTGILGGIPFNIDTTANTLTFRPTAGNFETFFSQLIGSIEAQPNQPFNEWQKLRTALSDRQWQEAVNQKQNEVLSQFKSALFDRMKTSFSGSENFKVEFERLKKENLKTIPDYSDFVRRIEELKKQGKLDSNEIASLTDELKNLHYNADYQKNYGELEDNLKQINFASFWFDGGRWSKDYWKMHQDILGFYRDRTLNLSKKSSLNEDEKKYLEYINDRIQRDLIHVERDRTSHTTFDYSEYARGAVSKEEFGKLLKSWKLKGDPDEIKDFADWKKDIAPHLEREREIDALGIHLFKGLNMKSDVLNGNKQEFSFTGINKVTADLTANKITNTGWAIESIDDPDAFVKAKIDFLRKGRLNKIENQLLELSKTLNVEGIADSIMLKEHQIWGRYGSWYNTILLKTGEIEAYYAEGLRGVAKTVNDTTSGNDWTNFESGITDLETDVDSMVTKLEDFYKAQPADRKLNDSGEYNTLRKKLDDTNHESNFYKDTSNYLWKWIEDQNFGSQLNLQQRRDYLMGRTQAFKRELFNQIFSAITLGMRHNELDPINDKLSDTAPRDQRYTLYVMSKILDEMDTNTLNTIYLRYLENRYTRVDITNLKTSILPNDDTILPDADIFNVLERRTRRHLDSIQGEYQAFVTENRTAIDDAHLIIGLSFDETAHFTNVENKKNTYLDRSGTETLCVETHPEYVLTGRFVDYLITTKIPDLLLDNIYKQKFLDQLKSKHLIIDN